MYAEPPGGGILKFFILKMTVTVDSSQILIPAADADIGAVRNLKSFFHKMEKQVYLCFAISLILLLNE
jgi:hypothetical protein